MNALLNKELIARQNEQQLMQLREDRVALVAQQKEQNEKMQSEMRGLIDQNNRLKVECERLRLQKSSVELELNKTYSSKSWRYTKPLRVALTLAKTARSISGLLLKHHRLNGGGLSGAYIVARKIIRKIRSRGLTGSIGLVGGAVTVPALKISTFTAKSKRARGIEPGDLVRGEAVSIIICVHNALDDVRNCLDAVEKYSRGLYEVILVDDGSASPTKDFILDYSNANGILYRRNEVACGYTLAANQGLKLSNNKIKILLNSDTIVAPYWLELIELAFRSSDDVGIVGPLSNTASWQSIPKVEEEGDWATNPLPNGWSVRYYAENLLNRNRKPLFPDMPLLNGFCLAIHSRVIEEIGYFDEDNFGAGYGEENDYCLRARKAGFRLTLVDNLYVFHAQSKSYSHERRKILGDRAGVKLASLHGQEIIDEAVAYFRGDKVLEGIRARACQFEQLHICSEDVRRRHEGRKVLFLLPVIHGGGGANIVFTEASAMKAMGAIPTILNLTRCKPEFTASYPDLDLPIVYIDDPKDLKQIASNYDAVIATANHTVSWMKPLEDTGVVLAYYIQDYEPYFYAKNSEGWKAARESYHLIDGLKLFTKTAWNREALFENEGVEASVVGCSYDAKLYRPEHRTEEGNSKIRIVAMVRPSSERRSPVETMETLRKVALHFGERVSIEIFGTSPEDLMTLGCDIDFDFNLWGALTPDGVRELLCMSDIFVDFSKYQAMGLTAMEAMACGLAVVAPIKGGAGEFLKHQFNGLLVDTESESERYRCISMLIENSSLRNELAFNAVKSMPSFSPEYSAKSVLDVLFS
jgi:GT2 family glycosyltransferase/glycosyltransferase involved in cell wall biosynthesis